MKKTINLFVMAALLMMGGRVFAQDTHEYVDLGLPSGTLWATCNVGANAPDEYGDYFAWGETAPKDVYSWSTYQYYDGGNLTKYTGSDGLTTLQPEDDAATANWGNEWRMPTAEEWQELLDNTTVTWTQQNGVNGRFFTGSNGNSLFLPAAGFCWVDNLSYVGSYGLYWSSSLDTDHMGDAWDFRFCSDSYYVDYDYRGNGRSVRAVRSASVGDDHEYVDLGLPSGLLWATCNVGANVPEEYGDYFAWGETQPKEIYNWSTYKYCMGSSTTLTKYCNKSNYGYEGFTDSLTILLPEDDAATANWGNEWRMPTKEEWQELRDNTTNVWTTQNGVNGRLFTGSNGNSLFLPAAGDRQGSDPLYVGSDGLYWSSSLNTFLPDAARRFFFVTSHCGMNDNERRFGQSVRAVRSASPSAQLPQVTTSEVTDIITSTATCGGEVVSDGGAAVTERGVCWATSPNPTIGGNHLSAGAGVGAFSVDITGLEPATTYYVRAYATNAVGTSYGNEVNFTTLPGSDDHEYVDLGLPSGLLWATCNVGANAPEEYGDYFAWGETAPKDVYDWDTYKYYDGSNLTKYTGSDNLTILLPEDDAATANWGDEWRMPTKEEWQELYSNTTVTWTQQSGVNGWLFTASNGNSLLLPAACYRWDDFLPDGSSLGYYWSSSLSLDYPYGAWGFVFYSLEYFMSSIERYYGQSVRAVRSAYPSLPHVTTSEVTDITTLTATCGGEVVSDGGTTVMERGVCWSTNHNPTLSDSHVSAGAGVGSFVVNATGLASGTTYYARAYATNAAGTAYGNEVSFTTLFGGDDHDYIDLGLPSGLLWATCNVGANEPEEYGDYFAWGETAPKNYYDWSTYQYCMGSENTLTKYCNKSNYGYEGFTDNLTTLLPGDDAATANWGRGWRMPTKEEWQELYNNTTVTWTQQNGVNGRLFTASNGNSLFLPAAGSRWGGYLGNVGSYGLYWSSSLDTFSPDGAWYFDFGSGQYGMYGDNRCNGHSVRAVRSARQN